MTTAAVIVPAFTEADRIGSTVAPLADRFDTIVVDDGSTADTVRVARDADARVVEPSLKTGLRRGTQTRFQGEYGRE